jgi:N-acetylglutamate synthase-like GNAT family acetyltransferase
MIIYDYMNETEVDVVYELILRVFHKHVAPEYSEKGIERFVSKISSRKLRELREGEHSFVIVARDEGKLIGMLALRGENHVSLIFIDSNYQGRGVGRKLVEKAIAICTGRNPEISTITVCSSPNSGKFYEEIGFRATDQELADNGLRYTPMRKVLVDTSEPSRLR